MKAAPSSASAHALEDIELVGFSLENFTKFMELYPHYYKVINDVLAKEMAILAMRSRLLRIPSSRERYTQLCKEYPELLERVPLTHIASYLKMALGTLSRVRAGKL